MRRRKWLLMVLAICLVVSGLVVRRTWSSSMSLTVNISLSGRWVDLTTETVFNGTVAQEVWDEMGAVFTEGAPNYGSTVLTEDGSGNYTLNVQVLDSEGQLDHIDVQDSDTGELLATLSIPADGDGSQLARSITVPTSVVGGYYTVFTVPDYTAS